MKLWTRSQDPSSDVGNICSCHGKANFPTKNQHLGMSSKVKILKEIKKWFWMFPHEPNSNVSILSWVKGIPFHTSDKNCNSGGLLEIKLFLFFFPLFIISTLRGKNDFKMVHHIPRGENSSFQSMGATTWPFKIPDQPTLLTFGFSW